MHVVYVMGQNIGGLPHYTAELANAVSEHADVTVLKPTETSADGLFRDDIDVREPFAPLGISMPKLYSFEVDPREAVRGIRSYAALELVNELDPDIVHDTTGLFPHVKYYMHRHGIDDRYPLVVTLHEVPMSRFPLSRPAVLIEELIKLAIPDVDADRLIVHTENQREALRLRGTDPSEIEVIPHGAYSVFGERSGDDDRTEPKTLLFFGNVVPPKGIDTLVDAIPIVKRDHPDVTLVIAGSGKLPKEARQTIRAHQENFEIHNYYIPNENVADFFSRAEVVVLPYRDQNGSKGHSGALSTAFSFGKPIVASTASEFPEQVEETGSGLTVPPEDPVRMAEAISSVLADDDARERMAANSLEMAERLSWSNVAEQYVNAYEDVIEKRTVLA